MSYMFHAKEICVEESLSRSLEHCYTLIEGLSTNTSKRHADCKTISCESNQPRLFNRLSSKQRDRAVQILCRKVPAHLDAMDK